MKRIAFILALAMLAGCSDSGNKADIHLQTEGVTENQKEIVTKASEVLFERCAGLKQYAQDIEWVKATTNIVMPDTISAYQAEKYGWTRWVSFEVKVSDDAKRIPADWRAWGHHLYYDVGSSPRPGVNVGKETGGWFCGIEDKSGFIPAPDAVAVDQLRT